MGPAARKLLILILSLLAGSLLAGCSLAAKVGAAAPDTAMAEPMAPPPAKGAAFGDMAGAPMADALAVNTPGTVPTSAGTSAEAPFQRAAILIYSATFGLSVLVVADALREVEKAARDLGGFFSRRDDQSITIRVPAHNFDEAVHRIEKLGEVVHRNVSVEDVTEEFTDIETRLKSARAVRDRLKELLGKATKVQDSLAIERELSRVDTEIDRMETRLKYLRDRAMYSTITVTFEPKHTDVDVPRFHIPVPWLEQIGLGRLLSL